MENLQKETWSEEINRKGSWIEGIDFGRFIPMGLGVLLFVLVYYWSPWPDAIDPLGKHFPLTREGKGALAVFLLAGTWSPVSP